MRAHTLATWLLSLALTACALSRPPVAAPTNPSAPSTSPSQPGSAQPQAPGEPGRPGQPTPRQFRLSAATGALVTQAHTLSGSGDFGQAAATLERALRIEPDNPLLWIELGRVRLGESNAAQADATGRKALTLAIGDASAQASAWRLIGDSLRARGRNAEAAEAEQRAAGLAPH
ncbi:MAG TPA: tetratricopeptide repeat protein [Candidatus Dormibacteraeota bacterium]|nr:tetratricopeptide repeat protein [Candidatus Dormibacteraeota bacterium]